MKLYRAITILFISTVLLTFSVNSKSQQSEKLCADCLQQMKDGFTQNSQPMKALLRGSEVAEVRTTLFEGNTYRISTCSPTNKKMWFSVYDTNNNLLFSSARQNNSSFWDFKIEGNLECIIEAGLMPGDENQGIALLLIGFRGSPSSF